VHLPADAPLGVQDIRIVTKHGISNPRAFVVGDVEEVAEKEPNDDLPQAQSIPLNCTVNGVIGTATDVDFYRFPTKKGQRVVVACLTSSIDSRLHAAIEVYGPNNKLLASNRNYRNNDAVTDAVIPEDGDCLVRVYGFTYTQGGPEYYYRLTVGTMPWIDAIVPSSLEPGKATTVTVFGRNLPGGKIDPAELLGGRPLEKLVTTIKAPQDNGRLAYAGYVPPSAAQLSGFDFRLKNPAGSSNPYLIGFAHAPVKTEQEPNDRPEQATAVPVPCEIAGRIERRGDVDWYRFPAEKGKPLTLELFGDRIGNAFTPKFIIMNSKGTVVAQSADSNEPIINQFYTRHEDPAPLRFNPAENGDYTVGVSAADNTYGPQNHYSLRIAAEHGDFSVVAMPISTFSPEGPTVGTQGHYAYTVFVMRTGNFAGDITVRPGKLPAGVTMKPQTIAGGLRQAAIVVDVAADAAPFAGPITLQSEATIDGKKVMREVRGATISYPLPQQQNNAPMLSRVDRELVLAVRGKAAYTLTPTKSKISLAQGDKISVGVTLQPLSPDFKAPVTVTAAAVPTGLNLQPVQVPPGKETTINFDIKGVLVPGNYTIVLRGQTQPPNPKQNNQKQNGPPNIIEHSTPIEIAIVPKQVFKIKAPDNTIKVARGNSTDVALTMSRLFPFDGPVLIEVPADVKGIDVKADPATANDEQVKLHVRAAADAPQGAQSVLVRVTARFNDTPVVHEVRVPINIK
jgi:hypothetical protein